MFDNCNVLSLNKPSQPSTANILNVAFPEGVPSCPAAWEEFPCSSAPAAELRRSSEQPTDSADYDSNSRAASTAIAEYWVTAGLLWLQCSNSLYQCLLSQRSLVHGNRTGTSEKTAIAAIAEVTGGGLWGYF